MGISVNSIETEVNEYIAERCELQIVLLNFGKLKGKFFLSFPNWRRIFISAPALQAFVEDSFSVIYSLLDAETELLHPLNGEYFSNLTIIMLAGSYGFTDRQ